MDMTQTHNKSLILKLLVRMLCIVFCTELVVDNLWPVLLPQWALHHYELADSTMLVLCSAPIVWLLVLQPLHGLSQALAYRHTLFLFCKLTMVTYTVELLMILLLPDGAGYSDSLPLQLADAFLVCLACAPWYTRVFRRFSREYGLEAELGLVSDQFVIMYKLLVVVLVGEYYVMKLLSWLRPANNVPNDALLDAALLGLIVSPFIWLLVVRPVRASAQAEKIKFEEIVAGQTNELLQHAALLQNLTRQVPGMLYQFKKAPNGSFSLPYASDNVVAMFETSMEEVFADASKIFAHLHPEDYAGVMASINESAQTLEPWQQEFRALLPKAGLRWLQGNSRPERLADGSILWSGFLADITELKQLELQLSNARKLESIGQLAGGVAHEVRNPLNAILTITEALFREKELEDNPDLQPYIQHIREQVSRLAQLMNDLLDLGKTIPVSNLQPQPLIDLCLDTLVLWEASGAAENRTWVIEGEQQAAATPLVLADSRRLQQVLFNLLENAGHHAPSGTAVRFRYAGGDEAGACCPMAVVQIIDSGCGIPPENITRIFEPFYTNRRGGTGLGLALVRHFIEEMGGSVRLWNNDPPPGCTAEIRIPLAQEVLS